MNSQTLTAAETRVLRADAERVRAQQDHRTEQDHDGDVIVATSAVAA